MERDGPAIWAAALDALVDVVLVLDDDNTVVWRRRSRPRTLPAPGIRTVVDPPIPDRIHPDDLPGVLDGLARLRAGEIDELAMSCRIYDPTEPTVLHDQDFRAFDARDIPGVNGILIAATVLDTRRAFDTQVHSDDFSLADAAPVGLALLAPNSRIIYANQVLRDHLGLAQRAAVTATAVEGLHELLAQAANEGWGQRALIHRERVLRATARTFGPSQSIIISTDDVTAELEAVVARIRTEHTWRATFDHTPAGIALVDLDGRFLEVNRAWTDITGHRAESLVGRPFADITHPDDLAADLAYVQDLVQGRRSSYRMEKRYVRPDGQATWVDLWVSLVYDEDDQPLNFVSQILDITDAKRAEAEMAHRERQLAHSATRDPESELPNRSIVEEHLRVAIPRASRRSDCAVLLTVEIEAAPDREVVVGIADRLSRSCRRSDVTARLARGAFAVLADPVAPDDAGRAIVERLRTVLTDPIPVGTGDVVPQVRVSARPVTADATVEALLSVGQPAS